MKVQLHRDSLQGFLEGHGDIVTIASTVCSIIEKVHVNSTFQISREAYEFYSANQGQFKVSTMFFTHKRGLGHKKTPFKC